MEAQSSDRKVVESPQTTLSEASPNIKTEDFQTQILKTELKKTNFEIDSYKKTIDLLQLDYSKLEIEFKKIQDQDRITCTNCFPPFIIQNRQGNDWQPVKSTSRPRISKVVTKNKEIEVESPNPFTVIKTANKPEQITPVLVTNNNNKKFTHLN